MVPFFYTFYRFGRALWSAMRDPEYEVLFSLTVAVLGVGTLFYHGTEGWGWLDSLYFSVITLTTVGYGDITPHTVPGKIFTMAYLFIGIGVLLGFLNAVSQHTIRQGAEEGVFMPKQFPTFGLKSKKEEDAKEETPKADQ